MKILHLTWSLDNGGAEKFTVELSNELALQGHQVTLCSVKKITSEMLPAKYISRTVKIIDLNIKKKYSLKLIFDLINLLDSGQYNAVHVHSSFLVFYILIISLFIRIKTVHTIHNTLTKGYTKLFKIISYFRFCSGRIKHVCISKKIYEDFKIRFPRIRFYKIDNGIYPLSVTQNYEKVREEIENLKLTKTTKVFLAAGNFSVYKNFTSLAKVFRELEIEGADCILIILGYDRSRDQEQYKKVKTLIGNYTFLLGQKENVADYIAASDALVISSLKEGMPMVALEALSMGKPVISTPAGGMTDVIEQGENGFLSESLGEISLGKAIKDYFSLDSMETSALNTRCLESFKSRFSITRCASEYLELYEGEQNKK